MPPGWVGNRSNPSVITAALRITPPCSTQPMIVLAAGFLCGCLSGPCCRAGDGASGSTEVITWLWLYALLCCACTRACERDTCECDNKESVSGEMNVDIRFLDLQKQLEKL